MGRKKKDQTETLPANTNEQDLLEVEKELMMRSALMKGTDCHYSFEALKFNAEKGYHKGITYKVPMKGTIVKDSFTEIMSQGAVHLACLDDAFELSAISFDSLDAIRDHELVGNYQVEGVQIKGNTGDFKAVITGTKYSKTLASWLNIEVTVVMEEWGKYIHREALCEWVYGVMDETELYMHGNYDLVEQDEPEDPKQTKIQFEQPQAAVEQDAKLIIDHDEENEPF